MDCGAASLGMICRHFGRKVSLARIRQLCHTATDGTSLKALCRAATELGLAARALKVSLRNLPLMPLPAIVHWEGNHWMVLYDVADAYVKVADPALGLRKIARKDFEQNWSGYAALFDYTIAFEKAPESKAGLKWLLPFFTKFRTIFLQVMLLAVAVTFLQLLFPIFTEMVVDKVIVEKDIGLLKTILLGMGAALFFVQASSLAQEYLLSFAAVRLDTAILDYLSRQMLALPMSYFTSRRTGDIQRRPRWRAAGAPVRGASWNRRAARDRAAAGRACTDASLQRITYVCVSCHRAALRRFDVFFAEGASPAFRRR